MKGKNDHPQPIGLDQMDLIKKKMEKSICKIKNSKGDFGTGFFCKMPFPDEFKLLRVLITNHHVLDEKDIKEGNKFKISLNDDTFTYELIIDNNRKVYTKEKYDITIIELKINDGLNSCTYLDIDDKDSMDDPKTNYTKKTVYLIHYPYGQKVQFSNGIIKLIFNDNITFSHMCFTEKGSSGGPLINLLTNKVIGIHKGSEDGKNYNKGILLKIPIQEFNQKYHNDKDNQMENNVSKNQIVNDNNNNQPKNTNNILNHNTSNPNMIFNNEMSNINKFENKSYMNYNDTDEYFDDYNDQEYLDILQMNNQLNLDIPNYNSLEVNSQNNNGKTVENLFPYIKAKRKEIIFINSKNETKIVKIPKTLRKNEIYSIAENYKSFEYYEITQLIHNNKILENDESSIDCISDGDSIKIIEALDNHDSPYYDYLLTKYNNSQIRAVIFKCEWADSKVINLPVDITGIEMKRSFLCKMDIPFKYIGEFRFIYNSKLVDNNEILKDTISIFSINPVISVDKIQSVVVSYTNIVGKRIKASVCFIGKRTSERFHHFYIGTLNQLKEFYHMIKSYSFGFDLIGNEIIYPEKIEVKENDKRTFSEAGIRNDFICKWKVKEKKYA